MNVQLPVHLDKPGFLAWVEGREERYELVEGRVIMMTRPTVGHGRIVSNLMFILRSQLDTKEWSVIADLGLDTGPDTLRCPDIVVDHAGADDGDLTATSPTLLIEVLSPSTTGIDLKDKVAEYLTLPDLSAYLVFAQSEAKAWCWIRGADGFPRDPVIAKSTDATIQVEALRVTIPLERVYEGVKLP